MKKTALLVLAVFASAVATARDFNTAEVLRPQGHTLESFNSHIRLGVTEHDLANAKSNGAQLGVRYQGVVLADLEFTGVDVNENAVEGSIEDFTLKVGYPIRVYPMVQVAPYAVYGQHRFDLNDDANRLDLRFRHTGVGVLAQMQVDSVAFELDLSKSHMVSSQVSPEAWAAWFDAAPPNAVTLDKRGVTTLNLGVDWNFADNHHVFARYSMFDWELAANDAAGSLDVEESMIAIGYAFSF